MPDAENGSVDGSVQCSVLDCHSAADFSQPLPLPVAGRANRAALHLCPVHFLEFQELSFEPFVRMHVLRDSEHPERGGIVGDAHADARR